MEHKLLIRPTYGELRKIHVLEYVEVIDKTPKEVPVVIHLYQEASSFPSSQREL